MKHTSRIYILLPAAALWLAACESGPDPTRGAPPDATVVDSGPDSNSSGDGAPAAPDGGAPPVCGNGMLEPGEGCEPTLVPTRLCGEISAQFASGAATCGRDCRWNVGACALRTGTCGDGRLDSGEACDPGAFEASSCASASRGFSGGRVACTAACALDFSGCVRAPSRCGDGAVEGGEQCDDGNRDDADACGNDCTARVRGTPVLFEGPRRSEGAAGAILSPGSACAAPATRAGWRGRVVADVLYQILLCETAAGPSRPEAAAQEHMRAVAEVFRTAAHVRLVEHSVARFRHPTCTLDYDSSEAARIASRAPRHVVPVVVTDSVRSESSAFSIGGYATEGGYVVTTSVAPGSVIVAHELGHFFGLAHTHDCRRGRETTARCSATGDLFCDTPADRGPSGVDGLDTCDDGARLNGSCAHGCGAGTCPDGAMPDRDNLMSYYHCWPGHFSAEQSDYVRCNLSLGALNRFNWQEVCAPGPEVCNNVDDDCDGEVDEDVTRPCGASGGECRPGTQRCVGGLWLDACEGSVAPAREVCDGRDNDCDGATDEDLDPLAEASPMRCPSQGLCASGAARATCAGGRWTCVTPPGYVADECAVTSPVCGSGALTDLTCRDGVDNDCDGVVDEHSLAPTCMENPGYARVARGERCFVSTLGQCGRMGGTYACVQRTDRCGVAVDCQGATAPETERCDDQDRDCDGRTYDRNDLDGDGYGDCDGRRDCNETSAAVNPGAAELCNGRDDDCDGAVDETFACSAASPSRACTVCGRATGRQMCNTTSCGWNATCQVGTSLPVQELTYVGNDPALRHNLGGSCNRTEWCQVGGTGYLSYGPFVPLGVAGYRARFVGRTSSSEVRIFVRDQTTGAILTSRAMHFGASSTGFMEELPFSVPPGSACHPIEFQMWVDLGALGGATLERITVMRDSHYTL